MTNEKKEFPYCAAGVFLAGVIVTSLWIHFLLNELKECDPIDSLCLRSFLNLENNLFRLHWCAETVLGWAQKFGEIPMVFNDLVAYSWWEFT